MPPAPAAAGPPNVLVILADELGAWSLDTCRGGPVQGATPSIDRLARRGVRLTDYYGQPSVAAGRAALLTGRSPVRAAGVPAVAELLAGRGYATAAEDGRPGSASGPHLPADQRLERSLTFMRRSAAARRPFFLWHEAQGAAGAPGALPGGVAELDRLVGRLLDALEELRVADRTLVVFTSASGAATVSWPEGRNSPFRGEKGTTWEGGFRVPCLVAWPGVIEPGRIVDALMSHEDWLPTLLAAAGDAGARERLRLDGYDFRPFLSGKAARGPRREILYFDDEANLNALRYEEFKVTMWRTGPVVTSLRQDPGERFEVRWSVRSWGDRSAAEAVLSGFLARLEAEGPAVRSGRFGVRQFLDSYRAAAARPGGAYQR